MQADVCDASAGRPFLAGPPGCSVHTVAQHKRWRAHRETASHFGKNSGGVGLMKEAPGGGWRPGCDRLGCQENLHPVLIVAKSPSQASLLRGELQVMAAFTCPAPYLSPVVLTIYRRAVAVAWVNTV